MGKYYVVELVLYNNLQSYITYTDKNPKKHSQHIIKSFRSKDPEIDGFVRNPRENLFNKVVELDVADSIDEAEEMVEDWKNYYSFLGLSAIS